MTAVTERSTVSWRDWDDDDVDRITAQARQVRLGRAVLRLLGFMFFVIGWSVARLIGVTSFAVVWAGAAVREGWRAGRTPRVRLRA